MAEMYVIIYPWQERNFFMYVDILTKEDLENYVLTVKDEEVVADTHAIISQETPLGYRSQGFVGLEYPQHHLYIFATDDKISYENEQKTRTIARSSWRTFIQSIYSLAEEKKAKEKLAKEAQQEIEF